MLEVLGGGGGGGVKLQFSTVDEGADILGVGL